jgi:hypothetical protein
VMVIEWKNPQINGGLFFILGCWFCLLILLPSQNLGF